MIFLQTLKVRVVNTRAPVPSPHHYSEEHSCFHLSMNKVDVILKLHLREDPVCIKVRCLPQDHQAVQHSELHLVPPADSLGSNWHQVRSNCPDCSTPVKPVDKPVDTGFTCKECIFYEAVTGRAGVALNSAARRGNVLSVTRGNSQTGAQLSTCSKEAPRFLPEVDF